ncbi:MAG: sugar ABC transporter permease [Nitrososphaerales archaeon]
MRKKITPWILIAGALILLFLNDIFPTIYALYLSFFTYNLVSGAPPTFFHLNNYKNLLEDSDIISSLLRGVTFSILTTFFSVSIGLALAFLMYKEFKGNTFLRVVICLPLGLPYITIGSMWKLMCNPSIGIIPFLLKNFGISYDISSNGVQAFITTLFMDLWHWIPLTALILLAALTSIPKHMLEAAEVDGANMFQKLRYIYLPMISGDLLFAALIRFMDSLRIFDEVWMLTGGGPGTSTRYMSIALYSIVLKRWDIGYGAAISMFFAYFIIFFSWITNKILQVRRI